MAAFVFTSLLQVLDNDGDPLSGGTVTVYQDGTTTAISLFSDEALSVSASNPITLDSAGRHDMRYFTAESYKVVIKNSSGVTLLTRDDIDPAVPLGTGVLAIANGGTGASTAATARTNLDVPSNTAFAALEAEVDALGGAINPPGGRLTLVTATPVMVSDATAITTVFYTPYIHGNAHLFDGTNWNVVSFSELSQTLADSTKSPAASVADNNYDMFLWSDSGTIRCTRGPPWTSATTRGTGGGTTELVRQNGVYVNTNAITNGPLATRGLYVGTIRTNSSNQVDYMIAPAAAAGGSDNRMYIWNMYNRVDITSVMKPSDDSWDYNASVVRAANTSTSNRITFVAGLNEEPISAQYLVGATCNATDIVIVGIGLDSITTFSGQQMTQVTSSPTAGEISSHTGYFNGYPGLGQHFAQALEWKVTNSVASFRGDDGDATLKQAFLSMRWRS